MIWMFVEVPIGQSWNLYLALDQQTSYKFCDWKKNWKNVSKIPSKNFTGEPVIDLSIYLNNHANATERIEY